MVSSAQNLTVKWKDERTSTTKTVRGNVVSLCPCPQPSALQKEAESLIKSFWGLSMVVPFGPTGRSPYWVLGSLGGHYESFLPGFRAIFDSLSGNMGVHRIQN